MADLVYQNYNNRCQGWTNPSSLIFGPQIISLSGYYSPAGSTTLVSINGQNFYSYSSISFGTFKPTVYFINSNILQFYVPSTLNSGTFPVQVFNGSVGSNSVNYTIDNASGYWLLTNGYITNTNTNTSGQTSMVLLGTLSRGAPFTITSDYDFTNLLQTPSPNSVNWIICNSNNPILNLTLPSGTDYTGREIMIKNIGSVTPQTTPPSASTVISTNGDIIDFGGADTSTILSDTGKWATIVYDGTNWNIMQGN
jgi:hypothetical protein